MRDYVLYSRLSDHETVLETWGASTKHPDAVFKFSEFKKCEFFDSYTQIVPWILECASKMMWPHHSCAMAQYALGLYEIINA